MLKLFTLFIVLIVTVNTSNAAFHESKEEKKETFQIASLVLENTLTGMVANLKKNDLERLTGRRLTLTERIAFTLFKLKARHQQKQEQTSGFNVDGFLIGFVVTVLGSALLGGFGLILFGVLGLLVVIGTFIFSKDKNYQKWTLLGWLAGLIASIIILAFYIHNLG